MKYLRTYNENASYLTEPIDPEFVTTMKEVEYNPQELKEYFKSLKLQLESLANKLNLNFRYDLDENMADEPVLDTCRSLCVFTKQKRKFLIKSLKYVQLYIKYKRVKLSNDEEYVYIYVYVMNDANHPINNIEDIEEYLKREFKVNENASYLTEPFDPEFDTKIENQKIDYNKFTDDLESHLQYISDKLGVNIEGLGDRYQLHTIPMSVSQPDKYTNVYKFKHGPNECEIELEIHYYNWGDTCYIKLHAKRGEVFYDITEVEDYLRVHLFPSNENASYLTEPLDPEFSTTGRNLSPEEYEKHYDSLRNQMKILADKYGFNFNSDKDNFVFSDGVNYCVVRIRNITGIEKIILSQLYHASEILTINNMEDVEKLLKFHFNIDHCVYENASYLTEPYDEEFETKLFGGTPSECDIFIKNTISQLKILADKYECKFKILYKDGDVKNPDGTKFVRFEKNEDIFVFRMHSIPSVGIRGLYSLFLFVKVFGDMGVEEREFDTMKDIEDSLKEHLLNENTSYLTEPYDPDTPTRLPNCSQETDLFKNFINELKLQMKLLADKLGMEYEFLYEKYKKYQSHVTAPKFCTLSIHQKGRPYMSFTFRLIEGFGNWYIQGDEDETVGIMFDTVGDFEEVLRKCLRLDENASYLTEPMDPEFEIRLLDMTKSEFEQHVKKLINQLELLADKLNLNIKIRKVNKHMISTTYITGQVDLFFRDSFLFYDKSKSKSMNFELHEIPLDNGKIGCELVYNFNKVGETEARNLDTLEFWLKREFNINENQSYLTEPFDPEFNITLLNGTKQEYDKFVKDLENQLRGLANKLGINMKVINTNKHIKDAYYSSEGPDLFIKYKFNFSSNRFYSVDIDLHEEPLNTGKICCELAYNFQTFGETIFDDLETLEKFLKKELSINEHLIIEFKEYSDLQFLLENSDNMSVIQSKFEDEISQLNSKSEVLQFFQYWMNKISNLSYKIRLGIATILVTICFNMLGTDILNINFKDNDTKELVHNIVKSKSTNQNKEFLQALADRESSGDWTKSKKGYIRTSTGHLNPAEYIGKYQFGYYAFKDIGKEPVRHHLFRKNPNIYPESEQDKDMIKLLKKNKHYLRNFMKYIGQEMKGIEITESGMLAASHLVGNVGIKEFLNSDGKVDPKDGNGVPCSSYLKKFAGYQLSL